MYLSDFTCLLSPVKVVCPMWLSQITKAKELYCAFRNADVSCNDRDKTSFATMDIFCRIKKVVLKNLVSELFG